MKEWMPFIIVVAAIIAIVFTSIILGSCDTEYSALYNKCTQMCRDKQSDNVGATFAFKDVLFTFGTCTCYARDGEIQRFLISTNDLRGEYEYE